MQWILLHGVYLEETDKSLIDLNREMKNIYSLLNYEVVRSFFSLLHKIKVIRTMEVKIPCQF